MCELLGMTANVPTDICFSFSGLMQRSGLTDNHRDGWGIAFYEGRGVRTFRDSNPGVQSEIARLVENYPIKSCLVISHIRKANRGRVCLENTHPFERELWGQHWSFAHNGQLRGIKKKKLKFYRPVGSTDSEYAFCWLMDQLRRHYSKKIVRNISFFRYIQKRLMDLQKLGVLNVLFGDSQYLYAFSSKKMCWLTRKAPFGKVRLTDKEVAVDFKKVTTDKDIVTIIATRPLTSNEVWQEMEKGRLYVFSKGVLKHIF